MVVLQIRPSHRISNAGSISSTSTTLMMAPRAISMHMEPTISMLEYTATPKVAANNPMPLTITDGAEARSAL